MAELFTLTTPDVRLVWSGRRGRPARPGGLLVEALAGEVFVTVEGRAVSGEAPLALTEETAYPVWLQSRTDQPVALRHRDPAAVQGLTASDGGRTVHGVVRFGATAGMSRFVVEIGGRPELAFRVAVVPTKVTTADLEAMQAEVEADLAGLALAYFGAADQEVGPASARYVSRPVWLTHLRTAVADLERALHAVARHPREGLERPEGLVRVERLARPDAAAVRAIARGAGTGPVQTRSLPVRARVPARPVGRTLDVPEHRWLRARVEGALRRLGRIRREEATLPDGPRRRAVRVELDDLDGRLRRLAKRVPLAEASPDALPAPVPLALRTAPGYAEAYFALQRLGLGLALAEAGALATPRDLAGLYETWCYLTLARTLASLRGVPLTPRDVFTTTARGVQLRLRRGRSHGLTFRTGDGRVHLAYEPRFGGPPGLLAQRPDFLLTVAKRGQAPRLYVLDAKYRRDDATPYRRRHGAPGPPEDALGDLHRYRDAIVTTGPGGIRRPVEAAVALYPYREDEPEAFARSRLWTSLGQIGVGAIPLLPEATGYLERWLRGVLG